MWALALIIRAPCKGAGSLLTHPLGAAEPLPALQRFCRSVITFKARTWKDAFPLVDLLRGVLQYLLVRMALSLD